MERRFLHKKSILGRIISQNSGCYPTKDKKVIQKLDRIFIFEKIKKLSIAHGQGIYLKEKQTADRLWEGSLKIK